MTGWDTPGHVKFGGTTLHVPSFYTDDMLDDDDWLTDRRPLLYIAGPYQHPDPVQNTHETCRIATLIYERTEWVPLVPHLSLLWHLVMPQTAAWWYEYDLHLLARCDALLRLPGDSHGADMEVREADGIGIPVYTLEDILPEGFAP